MQYHAEYSDHRTPSDYRTPWNVADRSGDRRVLGVYRRLAHLRRRFLPYLEEQARRSLATAEPVMQPRCFDHPDDEAVLAHPQRFQLGDDLLVAPVTTPGATAVDVYLSEGWWVDCFTGAEHRGPATLNRDVACNEVAGYRRFGGSDTLDGIFSDLPFEHIGIG